MFSKKLIYVLVIVWAVIFVGSIMMSVNIDGPRNIDTGFKRLDMLFRGQILAGFMAIATAIWGFLAKGHGRREKLVGLLPVGLTVLLFAGFIVFALVMKDMEPAQESLTLQPTSPVTMPTDG